MQAEFGRLIEANMALLFKVASAYCAGPGEREDLVPEIAAALWRSFARYDRRRPFRTWAFRVALNVAISFSRSARRRAVLADGDEPVVAFQMRLERLRLERARAIFWTLAISPLLWVALLIVASRVLSIDVFAAFSRSNNAEPRRRVSLRAYMKRGAALLRRLARFDVFYRSDTNQQYHMSAAFRNGTKSSRLERPHGRPSN